MLLSPMSPITQLLYGFFNSVTLSSFLCIPLALSYKHFCRKLDGTLGQKQADEPSVRWPQHNTEAGSCFMSRNCFPLHATTVINTLCLLKCQEQNDLLPVMSNVLFPQTLCAAMSGNHRVLLKNVKCLPFKCQTPNTSSQVIIGSKEFKSWPFQTVPCPSLLLVCYRPGRFKYMVAGAHCSPTKKESSDKSDLRSWFNTCVFYNCAVTVQRQAGMCVIESLNQTDHQIVPAHTGGFRLLS